MRKDAASLYSPRIHDIEREYQQWTKAHKRIKEGPPQEGRDYVKHAKTLLPILEAVSELHPIAKVAVSAFKAVVMYEEERKENDARVAVVFLAQSDMMGALLDLNQLAERRKDRWEGEDEDLRANAALADILLRVEKEIKASGNSMDTYYGEKRLTKFWKAQEWKDRILTHMTHFDTLRNTLQQTLSIQVAADVNTLMEKVDVLLLRLFTPKADWEKEVAAKTRHLAKSKNMKDLINDSTHLQTLVELTRDPSLDDKTTGEDTSLNNAKAGLKTAMQSQLEQLKKDLNSSLDALCDRNQEIFELKLNFHAQQIQEAILNSANYVVQSLSGPYDRLHNEDLKILWKEMNWIFCVDNKLFTSALFEYYLDHFSSQRHNPKTIENGEQHEAHEHDLDHHDPDDHQAAQQENLDKVTALSRVGVLNHPDAWTLEPMALYGPRISLSIDKDDSGFIRISEANAFTEKMPKGWTLPQWCAYAAIGWTYEARVYRKRINNILSKIFEMQAKVLPLNRFVAIVAFPQIAPFFQLMAWEPTDEDDETHPDPPEELILLVHEKIKQEDEVWRKKLRSLNWAVEDEAILKLLYGKQSLENYVLQLSVLLLEYVYEVLQACTKVTLDTKEIAHFVTPLRLVKRLCNSRVAELKAQFEKEKRDEKYLERYHGGIWMCINRLSKSKDDDDDSDDDSSSSENGDAENNDSDDERPANPRSLPFDTSDIDDYDYDEFVLEEFPLLPLADGELPYLKFKTWEEYIQSLPEDEIPDTIPNSWCSDHEESVDDDEEDEYNSRHAWTDFPFTYRNCDGCSKSPIKEHYYACTVCADFDICSECYRLPPEQHVIKKHDFSHPVVRFALHTADIHRNWMVVHAERQVEQVQDDLREQWDSLVVQNEDENSDSQSNSGSNNDEEAEVKVGSPYSCNHCEEYIPLDSATTFYKCFRHSCEDYWLCDSCAHSHIVDEDPDGHQWWHSLIVLRRSILVDSDDIKDDISEDGSENGGAKKAVADDPNTIIAAIGNKISVVDARISAVEGKLDTTNAMLQETLSTMLEDRVKSAVTESNDGPQVNGALENRVSQLEDKVDIMLAELRKVLTSLTSRSDYTAPSQPAYSAPRSDYQSSYVVPHSDYPASGPTYPISQPDFPTSQPGYSDSHPGYHAAPYSGYNPRY